MAPGQYTELFFLDEATALAAGHRPCAECRHADYRRFQELWRAANRECVKANVGAPARRSAELLDRQLQAERQNADGTKRRFQTACQNLPNGVFVSLDARPDAFLIWESALHHWTPAGYDSRRPIPTTALVEVLTPRSTVRTIAAGYVPIVHPSAWGASGR